MKLEYTVIGIQRLQRKLYQFSDEQLKIEADELAHNPTTWLKRWLNFNKEQSLMLISLDNMEKKMLAFELSFAVENRLPIRLTYQKHTHCSLKNLDITDTKSISSYWDTGHLQICINKYAKAKLLAVQKKDLSINSKEITPKPNLLISAISTRFNNLIKYHHGL